MSDLAVALTWHEGILFPGALRVVTLVQPEEIRTLGAVERSERLVLLTPRPDPTPDEAESLARVGVEVQVVQVLQSPQGGARALLEAVHRIERCGPAQRGEDGLLRVPVRVLESKDTQPERTAIQVRALRELLMRTLREQGLAAPDLEAVLPSPDDAERVLDHAAGQLELSLPEGLDLLAEAQLSARAERVVALAARQVGVMQLRQEISAAIQVHLDKMQREFQLREQLRAIRLELGDAASGDAQADELQARLDQLPVPEPAAQEIRRELERLRRMHPDQAETTVVRAWLDVALDLPWGVYTEDSTSLSKATRVLERDHFGLKDIKERILEYLAVRQLAPGSRSPILCFVGPPGVGKTSLGRSIAEALGRKFGRIALGGVKDEAEIRGHRRTYVGALPGRILRAVTQAGSLNPVLVLDELDKVGNDFRGDPASALLEVLDPAQNQAYVDHYLDLPVDLSQVLFIATANLADPIPPALHDRLEILEIPGYIEEDKLEIARRFLLPRLGAATGLGGSALQFTTDALQQIIRDYTREAGLRELERQLEKIHRKVARSVVEGETKRQRVTPGRVGTYLGPPKWQADRGERIDQPGIVVGLAWTASGGDILYVEATRMPGKGQLKLTGSLGAVMKESAEASLSWLRTHQQRLGLKDEALEGDFHVHVPAGATPKDGPSAGVALVTALASAMLGRTVPADLAMTGEISLRGRVLPVGGIKEKVLAARRAGLRRVILPGKNRHDLDDIPEPLRRDLHLIFVDRVDEVLALALNVASPAEG